MLKTQPDQNESPIENAALPLQVNGVDLLADPSGAVYWPDRRMILVADLHFEKGSGLAERDGTLLPPYDSRETIARLTGVVDHYKPRSLCCLGDSFHDRQAATRLGTTERAALRVLTEAVEWFWVKGNHDPHPPSDLGGTVCEDMTLGGLTLRHEAKPGRRPGEVSGHFHPKATVAARLRRFTGRCFVTDGVRLILPAFGAYTGGLDALDPAIAAHFPKQFMVGLIGNQRVFRFSSHQLMPRGRILEHQRSAGASYRRAAR